MLGLDFAGGRPGGAAILGAGYGFVVRYLSSGGSSLPGKQLLAWEAEDYRANGVAVVSNWETTATRMLAGYAAGVEDAAAALAQVLACGGRADRPIYFSADWDATEADQISIDDYLHGAATVLGAGQVGIYGGYWPVSRALDHGTAQWAWQTGAWSGSNVDPRINLYQRIGFVAVGGVQCDVNEARTVDYGQWSAGTGGGLMALTDDEQQELLDKVRYIAGQLGPWSQLGKNSAGQDLTLVDAVAAMKLKEQA